MFEFFKRRVGSKILITAYIYNRVTRNNILLRNASTYVESNVTKGWRVRITTMTAFL